MKFKSFFIFGKWLDSLVILPFLCFYLMSAKKCFYGHEGHFSVRCHTSIRFCSSFAISLSWTLLKLEKKNSIRQFLLLYSFYLFMYVCPPLLLLAVSFNKVVLLLLCMAIFLLHKSRDRTETIFDLLPSLTKL